MKILLADSGSTKTEWCLITSDAGPVTSYSAGLNPFYHTADTIAAEITKEVVPDIPAADRIYFYGAGCAGEEAIGRMTAALKKVYGEVQVGVDSDLLGAARAICGHEEGVACILGTGSNSCHYDGEKIIDQVPVLGFILGDEGSAGSFGRKILQGYFYREMPEELRGWLEEHYDMARPAILESVYKKPHFNTFVASFTRLFAEFSDHPYVIALLQEGISEFLERHVIKYHCGPDTPVGFVGSVAFHNQAVVRAALARKGLAAGSFLQTPMQGLREYHGRELNA
ncbi:hypothetical protein [Natronogracilivirga saccharolytica]|uniref:BadF-type ATPase n=1 Tax=Natronogracilivirga saccharolytica TaxID=2812953 RepID=A0A8J7SBF4_9BACT|nr:hypothetical protein [Natronogracilivirga saccharolytica]MBP3193256.1 hypothetical protein [Natronogracilivirga saccharolytica]